MNRAAFGDSLSRYHLEAAIAYQHCSNESFAATNWEKMLTYYEWLREICPSPFVELNEAVAVLCARGPAAAAEAVARISERGKLERYCLYHSLLGEIDMRLNKRESAAGHFVAARRMTWSGPERRLLKAKIIAAGGGTRAG